MQFQDDINMFILKKTFISKFWIELIKFIKVNFNINNQKRQNFII